MDSSCSDNKPVLLGSEDDSLREAFGLSLVTLGAENSNFVVFDADVAGGTGAHHFRNAFPQRFFQFGIAEQNMMAAAGGFSSVGVIPIVTTFAVFSLRCVEQVRLSIAYPRCNVKIVASHPGLDAGPDGASAQALEDLAIYRSIPGMTVISPSDPIEMALATAAILEFDGPVYMRSGRSPAKVVMPDGHQFKIGQGTLLRKGSDVSIIACGVEVGRALDAAKQLALEGIDARVVAMPTLKPLDKELVLDCASKTGAIVTAEDHNIYGGLGSAIAELLGQTYPCPIEFVGVKDVFGESGEPDELAHKYGLTGEYIQQAVKRVLLRKEALPKLIK